MYSIGDDVVDLAGKAWALPDTVIDIAYGTVGTIVGALMGTHPRISFGNNAIQFTNNPLMGTAMTFGNTIVYGTGKYNQPDFSDSRYAGGTTNGFQEMQHTWQAEVLGPLYFPMHLVSGVNGLIGNGY